MMKEFYDLFEECVFIPKDSKHFCRDIDVKLIRLYPQIADNKISIKHFLGDFRGLIEHQDVLGSVTRIGGLTLNFGSFKIIHKKLNMDISDLSYFEVISLKREKKIDFILNENLK